MFAAFHIPDLPIAAALLAQPEWRDRPCGILREPTNKDDGKIPLLSLNEAARHTGISAGWQLNKALVRCPDLKVLPRHPENETSLLSELTAFADSFTADVEITSPDTVLLDLSGTRRRHFDGMESLPGSEAEVVHALASTPDLARFAALEPRTRGRFVSVGEIGLLPLSLLANLGEGWETLHLLELLGIHTLGDFRNLPRQDLIERFGAVAGHWHDLVSGKNCRLLKLHRPPESFARALDFDDAVASAEPLIFIFKRLLHALSSRLEARHLAASVLEIRLQFEEGSMRREIHLPEPLADPAALLRPVQTFIESLALPSPVTGVMLDAKTAFPLSHQSDWTKRQLPNPERWADTLARLEALVGSGNVGMPLPLESHRPDAFDMRDATDAIPHHPLQPACPVPLRRFRPPLKIAVAFEPVTTGHPQPLALLTGPHCGEILERRGPFAASGESWDPGRAWQRLEWDIRVARAPLLRLVFQPADHWQLDGTYT